MASHAGLPFAEHIKDDLYRIYFTSRDDTSRSHVGWLELEITRPNRILRLAELPILGPGAQGGFDDAGTTLSCIVRHNGKRFFYYVGWSLRQSVPYHLAIGLAFADDNTEAPKVRRFAGPIVDRSPADPLFCTAPTVSFHEGRWRMWYVSGLGWPKVGGRLVPSYNTRHAELDDGVNWRREGRVVLDLEGGELGFSRPSITSDNSGYTMWYSVRGANNSYRLGFAVSPDGLVWTRDDGNAGLTPSHDGWDCDMIAYPHVFDHGDKRYMLYCGNDFGRSGFGLAVQTSAGNRP